MAPNKNGQADKRKITAMTDPQPMRPFVSVIVPVYNDAMRIRACIEKLLSQTYPSQQYEIIIIDNGSTDATPDTVKHFPVKYLNENKIQGSYAARNKGIRNAAGEIIAFTDSDCIPVPEWIASGVEAMYEQSCDLIGGNVQFQFSPKWSAAELCDSLTNMQIKKNISERKVGKTANLFVKSNVIQKTGLFPENLKSGGDVIWTRKAVRDGFRIGFAPRAAVAHPARAIVQLLKKQYRVGKGQPFIWRQEGDSSSRYFRRILNAFVPTASLFILDRIHKNGISVSTGGALRVLLVAWLCRMATGLGNLKTLLCFSLRRIYEHVLK
jgi:glycosyltransferase involved in cell wall biosynthesis